MSEEEIIEIVNEIKNHQIDVFEPKENIQITRNYFTERQRQALQDLLDLYNKEKEKNLKQFAEIENLKYTMFNMKHIDTINKDYISKDKIRELKEFYIKDCENKNIDLIPLENLIKNIDHLGINI